MKKCDTCLTIGRETQVDIIDTVTDPLGWCVEASDSLHRLISHNDQRVGAKFATYQITQQGEIFLLSNRHQPPDSSKDSVLIYVGDVCSFTPDRHIVIKICGRGRV